MNLSFKVIIGRAASWIKAATVSAIITSYSEKNKDFFFIEIGAGDGVRNDLLYHYVVKFNWKGILVEPVKYIFDKLVKNYEGHKGLCFEHCAISDKNETRILYRLKESKDKLPAWYDGLGSFNKEVILSHKSYIPNIENYLVAEEVNCVTLSDLLKKNKVREVDLLQLDTEGHDYSIIRSINFDSIKPKMIRYEHKHLGKNVERECLSFLGGNGYFIIRDEENTLCFLFSRDLVIRLLFYIWSKRYNFGRSIRSILQP